jgi:outer membrane protein
MMSIRNLSLAVVSSLLVAAPAFAQDAMSTSTDTTVGPGRATNSTTGGDAEAAYKRFAVVGSATLLNPSSDPVKGTNLDVDGDVAPTISASWYVTPNIAVELWGAADKFNHRVNAGNAKIGTVEQQPLAISGQYHFGDADQVFRPFVGVGYFESNFSNEDIGPGVGISTAKGAIGTIGLDMNITPTWFARTDVRYMNTDKAKLTVGGEEVGGRVGLDPWTVGIGIGARF